MTLVSIADELFARETWPHDRLLDYRRTRLNAIVRHAVSHSPYYREALGELPPGDVPLESFPTLSKQSLMHEWDRIVADRGLRLTDAERHIASSDAAEPLFDRYQVVASGGTTGRQSIAIYDPRAWQTAMVAFQRAMGMQGITPETKVLGIGSPSPLHMTYRLFGSVREKRAQQVPRISLTTPLPEVVDALNAFQPEVVTTYPSFIRRLAEEQQSGRLRISPGRFVSTAETLTPDVREVARDTWDALVLNAYGATEVNLIGAECPHACGAHVPEDLIVLEVVDHRNRPVPPGVPGQKILVTTLYNEAMPLIRYEISDLLSIAEGACPCGRPGLRIGSIRGRQEDVLTLPARAGGHVDVHAIHLHALLVHVPAIREFELSPRPETLLIRVSLREPDRSGEVLRTARREIEHELGRLGARMQVEIETVDEIARNGTGAKRKLVRNEPPRAASPAADVRYPLGR